MELPFVSRSLADFGSSRTDTAGFYSAIYRLEDVIRAAEMVGFVIERRQSLKEVRYTADKRGESTFKH